jgi:hypothetical protein
MQSPRHIYPPDWFRDPSRTQHAKTTSASVRKEHRVRAVLYTVRQLPSGCKLIQLETRPTSGSTRVREGLGERR